MGERVRTVVVLVAEARSVGGKRRLLDALGNTRGVVAVSEVGDSSGDGPTTQDVLSAYDEATGWADEEEEEEDA